MANDTIGSLVAVVRATAGQFQADISQINGSLASLKAQGDSTASAKIFEGFELGAGMEAFHKAVDLAQKAVEKFFETFERAHQVESMAAELNTTVTALEGLHHAAQMAGSSAETADRGLAKMQETIGKARQGEQESAKAFKALGLNLQQLANESSTDAFKQIADAIKGVGNASDEAALAVQIFGRGGREMLNVLREGSGGIKKMSDEQERLGGLTDETAEQLAAAGREITKMKTAWDGLWNTLAATIVPILTRIIDLLTDIIAVATEAIQKLQKVFGFSESPGKKDPAKPTDNSNKNIADQIKNDAAQQDKAVSDAIDGMRAGAEAHLKVLQELHKAGEAIEKSVRTPIVKGVSIDREKQNPFQAIAEAAAAGFFPWRKWSWPEK